MNIADQFRAFRLKELPRVHAPGELASVDECAVCHGPAGRSTGRHSGRIYVIPMGCGHPAYSLEDGPMAYNPSEETELAIAGLIEEKCAALAAKRERQETKNTKD